MLLDGLPYVQRLHLTWFFLYSSYYHISKRLTGVRHVSFLCDPLQWGLLEKQLMLSLFPLVLLSVPVSLLPPNKEPQGQPKPFIKLHAPLGMKTHFTGLAPIVCIA